MRLAIGTVQFGLSYGVSNISGQVCIDQVSRILELARDNGIDTLDTASAYGSSEDVLGSVGVDQWRVMSKIPPLPQGVSDVRNWVITQTKRSLDRMRIMSLDALMLHKPSDLLGSHQQAYLSAFEFIKEQGLASAIGYSVYSPDELVELCKLKWPDIVQVPFNVFDQRIKRSGWIKRLNQQGTRVHVRSAFLQGLLLMPSQLRPHWFSRWNDLLSRWDQASIDSGISPVALALKFVLNEPGIERVVVGVESQEQLVELLGARKLKMDRSFAELACEDPDLIEPYRWNLQ